jgi:hypothetical protein
MQLPANAGFRSTNPVLTLLLILFAAVLISCKKNTPENAQEELPSGTSLASGTFKSDRHATSGTVKLLRSTAGKIFLVFENFKTDNGPDLRVWLSPNTGASPYVEAGLLKAVNGNFSYELAASFNHVAYNHVLIWCEDVSVLFGHAVLQ